MFWFPWLQAGPTTPYGGPSARRVWTNTIIIFIVFSKFQYARTCIEGETKREIKRDRKKDRKRVRKRQRETKRELVRRTHFRSLRSEKNIYYV